MRTIKQQVLKISQVIETALTVIVIFILRIKISRSANLAFSKGTLLIANHQSMLDPWIATTGLGWRNVFRALPFRYPTKHKYMHFPALGQFLRLSGAYDIGATPLDKAKKLLYTRDLIFNKVTVLLFPEGQLVRSPEAQVEFQRGMHMLIQHDIPIVLVRIQGLDRIRLFGPVRPQITYSPLTNSAAEDKLRQIENFFAQTWKSSS